MSMDENNNRNLRIPDFISQRDMTPFLWDDVIDVSEAAIISYEIIS